ncbi:hypothetical protein CHOED_060 [Vibrio phage CHOED]|uniref:hypothetical protein n=1 Tax=Vibrio phage CHOED TaxID=1458716 RepID=UPI00042E93A8|nr:hypothetical protein CHOED_060 [Vibrio phage CHOED]AHK11920.1 hypothetical protein CHOED_060 [Vibrio phage CHOED]
MQKARIIKPISAGSRGVFGTVGTEGFVLAEEREEIGAMARLSGVKALYALAIPTETLTAKEIDTAVWLFDDDSGSFYDRMAEIIAAAPKGYVVTTADNTEIELIN